MRGKMASLATVIFTIALFREIDDHPRSREIKLPPVSRVKLILPHSASPPFQRNNSRGGNKIFIAHGI